MCAANHISLWYVPSSAAELSGHDLLDGCLQIVRNLDSVLNFDILLAPRLVLWSGISENHRLRGRVRDVTVQQQLAVALGLLDRILIHNVEVPGAIRLVFQPYGLMDKV